MTFFKNSFRVSESVYSPGAILNALTKEHSIETGSCAKKFPAFFDFAEMEADLLLKRYVPKGPMN